MADSSIPALPGGDQHLGDLGGSSVAVLLAGQSSLGRARKKSIAPVKALVNLYREVITPALLEAVHHSDSSDQTGVDHHFLGDRGDASPIAAVEWRASKDEGMRQCVPAVGAAGQPHGTARSTTAIGCPSRQWGGGGEKHGSKRPSTLQFSAPSGASRPSSHYCTELWRWSSDAGRPLSSELALLPVAHSLAVTMLQALRRAETQNHRCARPYALYCVRAIANSFPDLLRWLATTAELQFTGFIAAASDWSRRKSVKLSMTKNRRLFKTIQQTAGCTRKNALSLSVLLIPDRQALDYGCGVLNDPPPLQAGFGFDDHRDRRGSLTTPSA